jgi:hypothetical protein
MVLAVPKSIARSHDANLGILSSIKLSFLSTGLLEIDSQQE